MPPKEMVSRNEVWGEGHHMMPVSRWSAQPRPFFPLLPFIFLNAAHGLTATGIGQLILFVLGLEMGRIKFCSLFHFLINTQSFTN